MRLCTYSMRMPQGETRVGVVKGDQVVDLLGAATTYQTKFPEARAAVEGNWFSSMMALLRQGTDALALAGRLADTAVADRGQVASTIISPLTSVKLHAPIPRPGKIIAAGRNYSEHVDETKEIFDQKNLRKIERSDLPIAFAKMPSHVIGHEDAVVHPLRTKEMDYELELAVVIGRKALNVGEAEALDYVAGYTVANDISARDWLWREIREGQMVLLGKNFPTFCPLGPVLVTADEIPDPNNLYQDLKVNGEVRQRSNTKYMIFNVRELIAHWSMTGLEPGDVILCGTPGGVAFARKPDPTPFFLKPGDVMEATVEGIGTLRTVVVEPE